jgi:hypothetical protein
VPGHSRTDDHSPIPATVTCTSTSYPGKGLQKNCPTRIATAGVGPGRRNRVGNIAGIGVQHRGTASALMPLYIATARSSTASTPTMKSGRIDCRLSAVRQRLRPGFLRQPRIDVASDIPGRAEHSACRLDIATDPAVSHLNFFIFLITILEHTCCEALCVFKCTALSSAISPG